MSRYYKSSKTGTKTYNKMNYNNKAQSKQIAKNTRKINKIAKRPELKYIKNHEITQIVAIGIKQENINSLQRGTSSQLRIGDQITLASLQFKYIVAHTTESASIGSFRCLLITDTQNNNTVTDTLAGDIFQHAGSELEMLNSNYNYELVGKNKRYRIHYDSGFKCVKPGQSYPCYVVSKSIKMRSKIHYTLNNGNQGDIVDKNIFLYWVFVDTLLEMGWDTRLLFSDV